MPNKKNVLRLVRVEGSLADESVVELAQKFMNCAEAGAVRGALIACVRKDGSVHYYAAGVCADSPSLSMGIVARLKQKVEALLFSG